MPDEKQPDLAVSLTEVWEAIHALEEKVSDLVLQQTAMLIALAKTVPGFSQEFFQEYSDSADAQTKGDTEVARQFEEFLRKLRKDRT